MSLEDGLSRFIGRLYEAVLDPDEWRGAIAEMMERTNSRRMIISSVDLRHQSYADIQFHGPEDSSVETGMREYVEEMSGLDPTLVFAHENPDAGIFSTTEMIRGDGHRDHPFIKWSQDRFGSRHWRAFYGQPVDDLAFAVSFHPSPDEGAPTAAQLPLETLLYENLERAVRLAARPPRFTDDDTPLIAIDQVGRPLSVSKRAEEILAEEDGLVIREGVLAAQGADNSCLQRAIRAAIDLSSGERPGRGIRISRHHGKRDIIVIVSRFPPWLDHLPRPRPAALIKLVELDRPFHRLIEHSHLFGFSERETSVASALLEGHSVDSLSAALGISRNTARNHLQALFRKTQTNRQSDLVRVLDRLARQ
ncbi:MAG: helix-turn-helix transcriptional regulator [Sphingomicrobium sp.]